MFAQVNGLRLAYGDRGREHETTLLLVHGFPLDRRLWAAQVGAFADMTRVITPDLRGHGKSEIVPGPFTMEQHADDLAALLDHLKIRRAVVAGLSMGGYVAFAFWRRHPERVQGLILADTRAEPDSAAAQSRPRRGDGQGSADRGGGLCRRDAAALVGAGQPGEREDRRGCTENDGRAARGRHRRRTGRSAGSRRQPGYPADDHRAHPGYSRRGRCDHAAGRRVRPWLRLIPGARLAVIPRAGHLSPLENPRAFNAAVRAFLRGL